MDDELSRKLRRLGVVKGFRNLQRAPQSSPDPPARHAPTEGGETLPGKELPTPHGPVWVTETWYPGEHRHGCHPLAALEKLDAEALSLLGEASLGERPAFLDTETTGLAGGTGTLAFLTGVGIWEGAGLRLHQVFLRDPGEEVAALHHIAALLDSATGLVTFNGGPFDLPLLETRFVLRRLLPRWRALSHLDLLVTARLLWRDHLSSRRLIHLEENVLEVSRTEVDLPSWMIPMAYRHFLQSGETEEMERIFYHNAIDILSLATLLSHQTYLVAAPEQAGCQAATEWVGLGRLYARAERFTAAEAAWKRALEADSLSPDLAASLWRELGLFHKRAREWETALTLWESWATRLPWASEPLIERAKYFEWQAHDCAAALRETERALERATRTHRRYYRPQEIADLKHRRQRLLRKLED